MRIKNTRELENILKSAHAKDFEAFYESNKESLMTEQASFSTYMKDLIKGKEDDAAECFSEGGYSGAVWIQDTVR